MGWWLLPLLLLAVFVGLLIAWRPLRSIAGDVQLARACETFRLQREHLEAKFLEAADASGKPRGLRWKDCEWAREVCFARDRRTRQLHALVGVNVQFEAIPGSDMEEWPQVAQLRMATGVFRFHRGQWHTDGRAYFNMSPRETLAHFNNQYEPASMPTETSHP